MVDSDLRSIVPEWIELLAGPILKGGFDFVAPLYSPLQVRRHDHQHGHLSHDARALRPAHPAADRRRLRRQRRPRRATTSSRTTGTPDVSKFGIDIWMTTKAITGGFAVCQTRLGAKVHDPKDPGADLGPMFSQVVAHAPAPDGPPRRALAARAVARTTCPIYGFERLIDPPPLEVNAQAPARASSRKGRLNVGDEWAERAGTTDTILATWLATRSADRRATRRRARWRQRSISPSPTRRGRASSTTSCLAWHDRRVAARRASWRPSCPLYFGRVASLIIETTRADDGPGGGVRGAPGARVRAGQAVARRALAAAAHGCAAHAGGRPTAHARTLR